MRFENVTSALQYLVQKEGTTVVRSVVNPNVLVFALPSALKEDGIWLTVVSYGERSNAIPVHLIINEDTGEPCAWETINIETV